MQVAQLLSFFEQKIFTEHNLNNNAHVLFLLSKAMRKSNEEAVKANIAKLEEAVRSSGLYSPSLSDYQLIKSMGLERYTGRRLLEDVLHMVNMRHLPVEIRAANIESIANGMRSAHNTISQARSSLGILNFQQEAAPEHLGLLRVRLTRKSNPSALETGKRLQVWARQLHAIQVFVTGYNDEILISGMEKGSLIAQIWMTVQGVGAVIGIISGIISIHGAIRSRRHVISQDISPDIAELIRGTIKELEDSLVDNVVESVLKNPSSLHTEIDLNEQRKSISDAIQFLADEISDGVIAEPDLLGDLLSEDIRKYIKNINRYNIEILSHPVPKQIEGPRQGEE